MPSAGTFVVDKADVGLEDMVAATAAAALVRAWWHNVENR